MLYYGGFGVSLRGLAARLVVVLEGLFVVLYYGGVVSILSWEWLLYSASSYVGSNIYGGNGCLFFFAEGFFFCFVCFFFICLYWLLNVVLCNGRIGDVELVML